MPASDFDLKLMMPTALRDKGIANGRDGLIPADGSKDGMPKGLSEQVLPCPPPSVCICRLSIRAGSIIWNRCVGRERSFPEKRCTGRKAQTGATRTIHRQTPAPSSADPRTDARNT
jgi:hypothetical protein